MIFTIGDQYEKSFRISTDIYERFIETFQDRNPLHTDHAFAREKGFKGKVMHGNILNGFISYFIGECLPTKDVIIHLQEIQYKNPVYLNDEISFVAKVTDVSEAVNTIEFSFTFRNADNKTVAKGKVQTGILK